MWGVALPWLLTFSLGPSPSVMQSLVCGAALGILGVLGQIKPAPKANRFPAHWMAVGWLLAAGLSCIMALLQYFDLTAGLQPWVSASSGEAFANLRQRNHFAVLCLVGLAAWRWLSFKTPGGSKWWPLLSGSWFLLIAGNAASQSRTGLLGLLLLVAISARWRLSAQMGKPLFTWATLPVYAAASVLLPSLAGRWGGDWGALSRLSDAEAQCQSRVTLWSNALDLIQQKPWLGWGWGELDYAHYVNLYTGERFCAILDNAHNLPLHLAVELGVPMAVILCGGVAYAIWRQRPWAEMDASRQMAWMILAVIGLHSMLEYPLWYGPFQLTVLLCLALLWPRQVGDGVQVTHRGSLERPFRHIGYQFFAPIFGAFLFYVGWDYHRISQIYLSPQNRSAAYAENTLARIQNSWLFKSQVQFAELAITPLTQANAEHHLQTAQDVLHFSPEPRVIERLLDSAVVLRRDDLLAFHMPRYRAAFPDSYAAWAQKTIPPQNSPTFPRASQAVSHP
ncbi:MAG: O-antigen ligase C-terminal domain-containing protein [Betaproteobacteria bacterium]|jgi:hypothetical protein|nr:O-antigen ligase C-terminal domain-containing protein [Betaproteobacteria bacterium]